MVSCARLAPGNPTAKAAPLQACSAGLARDRVLANSNWGGSAGWECIRGSRELELKC